MTDGLPDDDNTYLSVHEPGGPEALAGRFKRAGWQVRKSGWKEFEATCDYGELYIEAHDPVLVHGALLNVRENISKVKSLVASWGLECQGEVYDESGSIVEELCVQAGDLHP